jgi:L-cysteine S-thiosulfotransferase
MSDRLARACGWQALSVRSAHCTLHVRVASMLAAMLFFGSITHAQILNTAPVKSIAASALRSGSTFTSATLQAQQKDDDANPGMLWVDQGRELFTRDCVACHAKADGLATKLPTLAANGDVITLESQINRCQTERVKQPAYPMESQPLLALATYIAFNARGLPHIMSSNVTDSAAWKRAQLEFTRIQGRLDFSCSSCHDHLYGKRIRAQAISQGHGVGFPAYRVEWQTLGSLNRRLRACFFGMETVVPTASDPLLADLELYLAWRGQGLPIEAPAVRR